MRERCLKISIIFVVRAFFSIFLYDLFSSLVACVQNWSAEYGKSSLLDLAWIILIHRAMIYLRDNYFFLFLKS